MKKFILVMLVCVMTLGLSACALVDEAIWAVEDAFIAIKPAPKYADNLKTMTPEEFKKKVEGIEYAEVTEAEQEENEYGYNFYISIGGLGFILPCGIMYFDTTEQAEAYLQIQIDMVNNDIAQGKTDSRHIVAYSKPKERTGGNWHEFSYEAFGMASLFLQIEDTIVSTGGFGSLGDQREKFKKIGY